MSASEKKPYAEPDLDKEQQIQDVTAGPGISISGIRGNP